MSPVVEVTGGGRGARPTRRCYAFLVEVCDVLRCANPAGHVVRLSDEDAAQLEGAICGEHKALLDAGAPALWQVDPVHMTTGSIVMGSDVAAGGLIITGLVGSEKGGFLLGPECGGAVTVVLEKVNGGGAREEVRLTMSKRIATELGKLLVWPG